MERLLNPDTGLIIWTILSFLILVGLLRMFAWEPLLGAVEARETCLREEREAAERARAEAEKLRREVEARLAAAGEEAKGIFARASQEGEAQRARLKAQAEAEAKTILEKTRLELEEERRRLVAQLRGDLAGLSVLAAERILRRSVDPQARKEALEEFLKDLDQGVRKA
ncbi:MAG: ATP synthase F0 subunit B [Elusimicrobia bacterium GWA2_69_24]|nr:MAG: ATP synthase F0 subunit B [Elusimicrobia bacterium GWA2_69_24]HBL18062.1 ATP synthase F0 subunit B [Elusimicrobiota bacterium]